MEKFGGSLTVSQGLSVFLHYSEVASVASTTVQLLSHIALSVQFSTRLTCNCWLHCHIAVFLPNRQSLRPINDHWLATYAVDLRSGFNRDTAFSKEAVSATFCSTQIYVFFQWICEFSQEICTHHHRKESMTWPYLSHGSQCFIWFCPLMCTWFQWVIAWFCRESIRALLPSSTLSHSEQTSLSPCSHYQHLRPCDIISCLVHGPQI